MSGGGSTTVQNQDPWSGAQPYLRDLYGMGYTNSRNPAGFYPGATYLGPSQGQLAGWDTQLNYADQVYGGAQAPKFGEATGALSGALTGNNLLGGYAGAIAPNAANQLNSGFSGSPLQTGGLDTTAAFSRALSGQPDYAGVQGAIQAANAPILRQFEQDILPGLNQRATFLGNPTGGIKTLNRVLPELGERMSTNAAAITDAERQRALGAQMGAAGQLADIGGSYRNQLLGLGQLGGSLAGQQSSAALQGVGMFPGLAQAGAAPGLLSSQFADWGQGFQQQALQDQMNRWNYYQNLPAQTASQYSGLLTGAGGLGGNSRSSTSQSMGGSDYAQLALAAWMFMGSDRRMKEDIEPVGKLDSGLTVYRYRYKGDPRFQIGVMADEVREKFPKAVLRGPDGFDRVDYRQVA